MCILWKKWPTSRKPFICNKILSSFELIASKTGLFRTEPDKVLNNILSSIIYCPQGRERNDSVWAYGLSIFNFNNVMSGSNHRTFGLPHYAPRVPGYSSHGPLCSCDVIPKELKVYTHGSLSNSVVKWGEYSDAQRNKIEFGPHRDQLLTPKTEF